MSLQEKLATVSKDSWHYRLTRYGLGKLTDHVKRACPYWLMLVPVALVTGTVRYTVEVLSKTALNLVMYLGYYPWVVLLWTLGFKPRYWRGLAGAVLDGKESLVLTESVRRRTGSYYDREVRHWYVPVLMAPVLTFTPLVIWVWDIGHHQADVVTALFWPYQALIAYAGLLALIALGNTWKYGAWPLVYRGYCAVCPELEFVESAPSRSQIEPAQ